MSESQDGREVPPWAAGTEFRMHELDPVLNDSELAIVRRYGAEREFEAGEHLWRAGETSDFFAVLDGELDVYRSTDEGDDVFITHTRGHYPGETITMSGGRALVSGRAATPLRTICVPSQSLRRLISTESELGEKILQSFILRRMRMIAENLADVRVIGNPGNALSEQIESFLSRSAIPYTAINPQDAKSLVSALLDPHQLGAGDLPVVIANGTALVKPTNRDLAESLGFTATIDCGVTYDVAIIGSGPAGLAAAVYAASEGLSVLVIENCAIGGQAGSSSKIENYMGFPTGITGQALTGRGFIQAQKFGAVFAVGRELESFECGEPWHKLRVDGNDTVFAKAVVVASGAIYRQPQLDRLADIGGVHYGASHIEGQLCRGKDVAIVGGGNSAGQAAVYLSSRARNVHILVRGKGLAESMSDYLVQRIHSLANVHLHTGTVIDALHGENALESLTLLSGSDQTSWSLEVSRLFIFIGAIPGTQFVNDQFALDSNGFILTGDSLSADELASRKWSLERPPYLLETSCPRVFAVGDVRSGSVKRVAAAVGEGSGCVQFIHRVLDEAKESA